MFLSVLSPGPGQARRICRYLLVAGVLARVLVFSNLSPFNNDPHLAVIQFVEAHGRLPESGLLTQAYHPPLYYLLALPVWKLFHVVKAVQALSLAFSIMTLWALDALLRRSTIVPKRARPWCLALAAFHPQFIVNSLFISNDSLAILLGTCVALAMSRAALTRRLRDRVMVGLFVGLGLLTKHVFLAYLPAALFFLAMVDRKRAPLGRRVLEAAAIGLLAVAVGCWKFVVNWLDYGNPLVSNLDFGFNWVPAQRLAGFGWKSLFDFNLVKLTLHPIADPENHNSIPLVLYGSAWHAFLNEASFPGNTPVARLIGRLTYWAALAPTLTMLVGAWRVAAETIRAVRSGKASARRRDATLVRVAILGCLALNCALVLTAGLHYGAWTIFQARLLMPACAGWAMIFGWGLDAVARRGARWERLARGNLWVLYALFILFIAAGVVHSLGSRLYPRARSPLPLSVSRPSPSH
jgi:4-amino-4-deoxy-L-arabinose transferase-like glycosyltransferase